ncbi:anti-sigma F factor [Vallitalea maricola]|uniref:Anti-sigma F factor n=1 Tax=Vallitalea maricola TaxID=3074433 RepID=A0ACB5UMW2_9FIRM|nr:anti-sigma F factor [Vallitalea sp. AN17-2]
MKYENEMKIEFSSKSQNESFARVVIASFVAQLDPTLEELSDIKTAVSEAVTNAIIHGYEEYDGKVYMYCKITDNKVYIEIKDFGKGIGDIDKAREPLFTSKPELERSGMGFTVMETFMDEVEVESKVGVGSKIIMRKKLESLEKL